jgi:hypothetical protein
VRWVDDDDRVIVVNEKTYDAYILGGIEAVIWRGLGRSCDFSRLVDLLTALGDRSRLSAELELGRVLAHWNDLGLLEKG